MDQPPIADYALIGDTRTGALCSRAGSIDWLCLPQFDSDPIFGALIAGEQGGSFSISIDGVTSTTRSYRPRSAVLETRWQTDSGHASLTDGMVLDVSSTLVPQALLVRRVACTQGRVTLRLSFDPRLGVPGRRPRAESRNGALVCSWRSLAVALFSKPHVELRPGGETALELRAGEHVTFAMGVADRAPLVLMDAETAFELLDDTDAWWRRWSDGVTFDGPFREDVLRSLITLRLMTFSPSGAPVAAATTSLPEVMCGAQNWDYRLSWPRDASIGIASFLASGKREEAHAFMHWLLHTSRLTRPRLEVLYTLYGKPGPREREVDVSGYRGSRPVRLGNAASTQHQLDVYGWVVDAAWLMARSRGHLHRETWRAISGFADYVASRWREPDAGLWEDRGEPQPYVHSKLMAWLALDRALRIAKTHRTRASRLRRWSVEKHALENDVRTNGFDAKRNTYVRAYGRDELDAALLLLPVIEFDADHSHRVRGTIDAIRTELRAGGALLFRYPPQRDVGEAVEGAFLPCSFWLVQALARTGETKAAVDLFEELLAVSNDVGLFAEEVDPTSHEFLGNFPQALTHATLVQAALSLQDALKPSSNGVRSK